MRKLFALLSLLVVASMLLAACGTTAPTAAPAEPEVVEPAPTDAPEVTEPTAAPETPGFTSPDATTFVIAESEVGIDTLDPALAYDTASAEVIQNTYETLVFYDGEATDAFVPMLAESWEVSEDGSVYTFKIRSGVKFHQGGDMTPSDVAYSFQRGLLQGGYSSPQWLLAEPFFGVGNDDVSIVVDGEGACADDRECLSALPAEDLVAACEKVQGAIVADDAAGTVTMTLAGPWGPFLPTIAQTWGSVMDKEWVIETGGWDGSCDTWQNFYGMSSADDPFSTIANGTGPFTLEKFANGEEIILARNESYWREPAKLERVVLKSVPEWGTRFSMMQAGDADLATVPSANRSQMDELVGEKCVFSIETNAYTCEVVDDTMPFRVRLGRPGISQDVILYNWNIATSEESPNPYIGSGTMDGNGVPADFFSDVHVRRGFSYAFDWETFISDVYNGEATQSFQLTLPGMPGFFLDTPHYTLDLEKSAEEFKMADLDKDGIPAGEDPEGDVWTVGFRVQMAYNQGNPTRQTTAEILAGNLAEVNELFVVETLGLPWPAYLRSQRAKQIPLMTGGWLEDIHDPHNWYQPYTTGTYGGRQSLPQDVKDQFSAILDRGVSETDPAARAEIYKEANQLYYDLAVGTPLVLATGHGFSQRWVQGVILNPIFPGLYYYTIYKD
ncbi:MAG: ABC transporter substrate-binding protein [Chloroflexi bacterium]|nr:ABC transporter substrate-binding protein [Chloroflexota bacterium]